MGLFYVFGYYLNIIEYEWDYLFYLLAVLTYGRVWLAALVLRQETIFVESLLAKTKPYAMFLC